DGTYAPWPPHTGDIYASAERQIKSLEDKGANLIIALTHQAMQTDRDFAEKFKGRIHLVAGGHEHDRQFEAIPRGVKDEMPHLLVTKADANAKSAYVHRFAFDEVKGVVRPRVSRSAWISVDSKIEDVNEVREITKAFEAQAKQSFRKERLTEDNNYAPDRVIWKTQNDLDGRESKIRTQKTFLSETIGRSLVSKAFRLQKTTPKSGSRVIGAIYHGGTIRIDDKLMSGRALADLAPRMFRMQANTCEEPSNCKPVGDPRCEKAVRCPGEITEYDILRIAPFPETVLTWMELSGDQISTLYLCNDQNTGTGSYLHFTNIFKCSSAEGLCYLAQDPDAAEFGPSPTEVPIQGKESYTVASLDYFSHIAAPNHKNVFKTPPSVFPAPNDLTPPTTKKKDPAWVIQNDIRRVLVEEPKANPWVAKVINDVNIEKSLGYGTQPENKPKTKEPRCIYQ
ncbi:MAG: hypothetical protein K2X47_03435, partial [Bdellovibrionales bacterium]|nr:hypothetical protein [Bdellovibrionales bacterium]